MSSTLNSELKIEYHIILAGGGLTSGLIAWKLKLTHPGLRILVLEAGETLGGNHTWSFHGSDLNQAEHEWIAPLVEQSWSRHEVRFPEFLRVLESPYFSANSRRFHETITPTLGASFLTNVRVATLSAHEVILEDGRCFSARCVLDGRGLMDRSNAGFQKFLGLDVTLEAPHGLKHPILMDANCPQIDGFRFFYVLPWSERELLIEDTRYSESPELDEVSIEAEIRNYAQANGWRIAHVSRRERGVLPLPLKESPHTHTQETAARIGTRSRLFHFTTGYSFPWAIRTAMALSRIPLEDLNTANAAREIRVLEDSQRSVTGFFKFLNRMLFLAAHPKQRYLVLARFYRLPSPLIQRFYSGHPSIADRVRILWGKPPVPILRAAQCILEPRQGVTAP